jgi:hypothetical protein
VLLPMALALPGHESVGATAGYGQTDFSRLRETKSSSFRL